MPAKSRPAKPARRQRQHCLYVTIRPDTGALQITGYIKGYGRVRQNASTADPRLADEEAKALQLQLLRGQWHGERRGVRPLSDAVTSYLKADERNERTKSFLMRIARALGDPPLASINQQTINQLRDTVMRPGVKGSSVSRTLIAPLRAVLIHANAQGWCDVPKFVMPRQTQGRTKFVRPDQMELLIAAAARHLQPLLSFLVTTGARMSEAIELDWDDLDLQAKRVNFWKTKSNKPRLDLELPMRAVLALAALPHRQGAVFLTDRDLPYADKGRNGGGQIKGGFQGALDRANQNGAGIDPDLTPHDLRHTWASWHYAVHKDLLLLKRDGGWSSVLLVERYAHLMKTGQQAAIEAFRNGLDTSRDWNRANG
jgi:integrase